MEERLTAAENRHAGPDDNGLDAMRLSQLTIINDQMERSEQELARRHGNASEAAKCMRRTPTASRGERGSQQSSRIPNIWLNAILEVERPTQIEVQREDVAARRTLDETRKETDIHKANKEQWNGEVEEHVEAKRRWQQEYEAMKRDEDSEASAGQQSKARLLVNDIEEPKRKNEFRERRPVDGGARATRPARSRRTPE